MTEPKGNVSETEQQKGQPATVQWTDPGVKGTYANSCTVSSTREEIVLNLGLNQSWERAQADVQVQLTNRIILSPYAAKRLALLLAGVMQQYEARFGALDLTGRSSSAADGEPAARSAEARPRVVK